MHDDVILNLADSTIQISDFVQLSDHAEQSSGHGRHNASSFLGRPVQSGTYEVVDDRTYRETPNFYGNDKRLQKADDRVYGKVQETEETESDSNSSYIEPHELVAALRACADEKNLNHGARLHAIILGRGLLDCNVYLGNALVSLYIKCGALWRAQHMFDELPIRNIVSWNAIISGSVLHGHPAKAIRYFEQMQIDGLRPNLITYICVLKACAGSGSLEMGASIHTQIVKDKSLQENGAIGSALVDMYAKFGLLTKAEEVFDNLPCRNLIAWNALIVGYTQNEQGEDALQCLEQMQLEGILPDHCTFSSVLKSCSNLGALDKGQEVHMRILKEGMLDNDSVLGTALVDMYVGCGHLGMAQKAFDGLAARNEASWNALLAGYLEQGKGEIALRYAETMKSEGHSVDAITCVCILVACSKTGSVSQGQEMHAWILKSGLLEEDSILGNALIDMYAKCGLLQRSCNVLYELGKPNVVSWNALIAGYAEHEHEEEAVACLQLLKRDGLSPDAITYLSILKACTGMGSACKGQQIHIEITKKNISDTDAALVNALIGMYTSCGMVVEAQDLFEKMVTRNIIAWNALVGGYAQHGYADQVFTMIDDMTVQGIQPDLVTFNSVLNTCSHGGLVTQGQGYFKRMTTHYGILPTLEHHTSMVGLVGRTGNIEKAIAMIMETPFASLDFVMWQVVLTSCREWNNLKFESLASRNIIHFNVDDPALYMSTGDLFDGFF